MVDIEEALKVLSEYVKLNFPLDIRDFAIIIYGDGAGCILGNIANLEFPMGDQIYEFANVTNMLFYLKEMLQRTIDGRREEVLNKIKKDMLQYGITVAEL